MVVQASMPPLPGLAAQEVARQVGQERSLLVAPALVEHRALLEAAELCSIPVERGLVLTVEME